MTEKQKQMGSVPTPLNRSTLILRRLHGSIQGRLGHPPSYADMEEWSGVAERTVKDWFNNTGRPTVEFLLELLERVPAQSRDEIMQGGCRAWPMLGSTRLKCDLTVISQLKTIISQPVGLTFVQGGTEENRTFLINSFGNSFLAFTQRPRQVVGIDVHEPDWFVPVPGVEYLHNIIGQAQRRTAVRQFWPSIVAGRRKLVLLNGVWSAMTEFCQDLRDLVSRCHVIIADVEPINLSRQRLRTTIPITHVILSQDAANVLVDIRAG